MTDRSAALRMKEAVRPYGLDKLPTTACGLKLHKHIGDKLVSCELVVFHGGRAAVDVTLRRAAISGLVDVEGPIVDYFADIYVSEHEWTATVSLDRNSYAALKNKWMRCKVERDL